MNKTKGIFLLLTLVFSADFLLAQSEGSGTTYFTYILLAVVVVIFFGALVQVSDNLLAFEEKKLGINSPEDEARGPSRGGLFSPKLPNYAMEHPVTVLKKGYDIHLEGEIEQTTIEDRYPSRVAVQPQNFLGLMPIPKMLIEEGAVVKAGDSLFFDKKMPDIKFAAPVSGEVVSITRGAKRAITEVVILADKEQQYRDFESFDLEANSREELVSYLLESGLWPMFRQRPFNVPADPKVTPRDIFVSTFDTAPLAPDNNLVVAGRESDFQKGLDILNKLTTGKVYLSLDARSEAEPAPAFFNAEEVEKRFFHGKHPAGNVGVQIHHIRPIAHGEVVWTMGVQEVLSLGALFTKQQFDGVRVVGLTGSNLKEPKYIRTYIGANIGELVGREIEGDSVRIISGDVLSGQTKTTDGFLNFFDDQITIIKEGNYYELFGWLLPGKMRPTTSRTFPNFLFPKLELEADTNTHGEKRAFVVTGQYERMLPMDVHVQALMKSILINDVERMEGLGINELVEEDVALAEFSCTSKQPLQQILRQGLDIMRAES